jgi:hypothetical protein
MLKSDIVKTLRKYAFLFLFLSIVIGTGWSAVGGEGSDCKNSKLVDAKGDRYIVATHVEEGLILDGWLDDSAWQGIHFQGCFVQREPIEGDPATERTEVGICPPNLPKISVLKSRRMSFFSFFY